MRRSYGRAIPVAWRTTAALFVALGDPHRQRILLMFQPGERLRVADIVAASPLSRTAVGHHLRVMREAGVLRAEKRGKEMWYWPDVPFVKGGLEAVLEYLDGHA
jgi:DNA-binding transcriptional ArsR family regulator